MTLSLVVDNDATVNAAIIARHGLCVVITINGGISHSAHQFRAACPTEGLAWERRANESLEQFHGRAFQSARANNAQSHPIWRISEH